MGTKSKDDLDWIRGKPVTPNLTDNKRNTTTSHLKHRILSDWTINMMNSQWVGKKEDKEVKERQIEREKKKLNKKGKKRKDWVKWKKKESIVLWMKQDEEKEAMIDNMVILYSGSEGWMLHHTSNEGWIAEWLLRKIFQSNDHKDHLIWLMWIGQFDGIRKICCAL